MTAPAIPPLFPTGLVARRLRFGMVCETLVRLSAFPGFTLFGALKTRLAVRACVFGPRTCRKQCAVPTACVHGRVFDVQGPPEKGLRDAPSPLILHLPEPGQTTFGTGDVIRFEILLLGADPQPAAYLIGAVRALESHGLGINQEGRVRLTEATITTNEGEWDVMPAFKRKTLALPEAISLEQLAPPALPGQTTLLLETPLRLRKNGRWLNEHDLTPVHLAEAVLLRLGRLSELYGEETDIARNRLCEEAAAARVVKHTLVWWKTQRRSRNHDEVLPLDGVVGRIALNDVSPELASLFAIGSVLHLGSKTTHGYGQLSLQPDTV